ncbi:zinc finger protein 395-like [Oncorhynchus keta]|uniref:zinc finger protein 395-like n=1 Tax=Oncorhynchus keta TaxID=8018 RepID=UPI00227D29A3|nr:zinc finger protein 395-like [Oncorhynchus keta]
MATKRPGERTSPAAGPTDTRQSGAEIQETLVYMQCCGQEAPNMTESNGHRNIMNRHHQVPVFVPRGRTEAGWTHPAAPQQTTTPKVPSCPVSAPYSFRSPGSVEMDEIMAAMVLTSLSCSPVVQSSSQGDPVPGKLSSFRGAYRCLWPSCGKVLTSSVGMKRHVRVMHLGSGSEQSHREEDFYYTKFSCKVPPALVPALSSHVPWASRGSPPDPGPGPGSCLQIPSSTSSSHSGSGSSRPSSGPGSTPGSAPDQPSPLSQSAPSSFWQTDHPYQACTPLQVTVSCHNSAPCCWTPPPLTVSNQHSHHNSQVVRGRCRSVSVGEQWLQQNSATKRLTTMRAASPSRSQCSFRMFWDHQVVRGRCRSVSVGEQWLQQNSATKRLTTMRAASPSRSQCSFRKGRGEAKKCRKVYGVEHKEQWCTACRWKKACQRFTD